MKSTSWQKKIKELKTKLNFKVFQNDYIYLTSVFLPVHFTAMPWQIQILVNSMPQRLGKGSSRALLLFLNGNQFFNHLKLAPVNNISLLSFNKPSWLVCLLAQKKPHTKNKTNKQNQKTFHSKPRFFTFPAVIQFSPFLVLSGLYYLFITLSSALLRIESCHKVFRLFI